ncbi:hypothetical protein [Mycobacterium phage WXIN]|nr:hypothetical protein [Mycobacterium phage WXIN]
MSSSEVIRAVCGFADSAEAWNEFHQQLLDNEAVRLPDVGWAYLEEDTHGDQDSYGYSYGDTHFVFRVATRIGANDTESEYFRKWGEYDSYESEPTYDGRLEVVKAVTKSVSNWEAVR